MQWGSLQSLLLFYADYSLVCVGGVELVEIMQWVAEIATDECEEASDWFLCLFVWREAELSMALIDSNDSDSDEDGAGRVELNWMKEKRIWVEEEAAKRSVNKSYLLWLLVLWHCAYYDYCQ